MSTQYFNLHTTGIGYLNDIRIVQPKKGNPFVACRIAALTGSSDQPEYRYFDTNVVGAEAEKLIKRCQDSVNAKKKVLISFVMADLWFDTFTYSSDSQYHKKGDIGVSLKGRLIRIKMIKIDGKLVYSEKSNQNTDVHTQSQPDDQIQPDNQVQPDSQVQSDTQAQLVA